MASVQSRFGLSDDIVPMEGWPIGSAHQGDVQESIDVILQTNQCSKEEHITVEEVAVRCSQWHTCESNKDIQLCLHDRGHVLPVNFMSDSLDRAEQFQ